MLRRITVSLVLAACALPVVLLVVWAPGRVASATPADPPPSPVGLSLFFEDGHMAPITLVGDPPRYLQEVDIVVNTPPSSTDRGIAPLIEDSELSNLDWRGVEFIEEDWRSSGDGTFQRQRFYRGARWMTQASQFELQPMSASGKKLGSPLKAHAGKEDQDAASGDGFVRRFVVRQVARNCAGLNDTTNAVYTVQALVQYRDALHADHDAQEIPAGTASLRLKWTAQSNVTRTVPVAHADADDFPFGYGFQVRLNVLNHPSGGTFHQAGDNLSVQVSFLDGNGRPLYPTGTLPSYNAALSGQDVAGLRYYDGFRLNPTLYYAFKHRESNLLLTISGPTNKLKIPNRVIDFLSFLPNGAPIATVATDEWSSMATTVPPPGILLGGLIFNPALWDMPSSDISTIAVPADAQPGTYVLALKARREFGGEALNRAATLEIQVGQPAPTTFTAKVGNCKQCHNGPSDFGKILHGVTDFRACYTCHAALTTEPDGLLDLRVHYIHDRSGRFRALGGNMRNCQLCHLTPPQGPAKGLLNP